MDQQQLTLEHLNLTGCVIKTTKEKGRGVYASQFIPSSTLVEISPVLFFSPEDYEAHGKHTYTFKWTDGRMALALGLGSLFNHSNYPNLLYTLDTKTNSIRYTTIRDINADEELCIFYGHNLWFTPVPVEKDDVVQAVNSPPVDGLDDRDEWGGLNAVDHGADVNVEEVKEGGQIEMQIMNPYAQGDPDEIIPEESLPFTRFKLPPEEEDPDSIRTIQAWAVDIPDQRYIAPLLKWLKQSNLDTPNLAHLRRIRKQDNLITLLISLVHNTETDTDPLSSPPTPNQPALPSSVPLPAPYILPVPASSALTLTSLSHKSALWPTVYTPRRKDDDEPWTRGKLRWAWDAMWTVIEVARRDADELPIATYIPTSYSPNHSGEQEKLTSFTARDTRKSSKHPLRHATMNVIRALADHRASTSSSTSEPPPTEVASSTPPLRNGTNYLLTNLTLFITHEPCIMCGMALLHSRVKEVVYWYPSPQTGGCGGSVCVPILKGVNHRFGVLRWKEDDSFGWKGDVNWTIDV